MAALTIAQFRVDFPEFGNGTTFPDAQLTYWLAFAGLAFNVGRWGSWLTLGQELYMAHNLVLEARAQVEATAGQAPGVTTGAVNSKSVDKVSAEFDTGNSTEKDGGQWNTTIYGTRYLRMARMIGAGPMQIGMGCVPGLMSSASAYPGPWYTNYPNPSDS